MVHPSVPLLRAIFTELPDGSFQVYTAGAHHLHFAGKDFKDVMQQLVNTVALLKKIGQLPKAFALDTHLVIGFEN